MEIEFGAARVNHHLAGVVVEKEGHVHALGGHFDPLAASTLAFPLPGHGAVVVTGSLCDGRNHGVRADGEAAEFDHAERSAANFRNWRVKDEVTALEQAEALEEQENPGAESDDAPDDGVRI